MDSEQEPSAEHGIACPEYTVRRSLFSYIREVCSILLPVSLCFTLMIWFEDTLGIKGWVDILLIYQVVRVMILAEMVRRYFDRYYILEPHRVIEHDGRLSFNYKVTAIKYADIRESELEQTLVGRIFGFGDIGLGTAATSEFEVTLKDVPNPAWIMELIQERRSQRPLSAPQD